MFFLVQQVLFSFTCAFHIALLSYEVNFSRYFVDFPLLQSIQIVLLDFDGLLVNTEQLHFAAYQRMCSHRGFTLAWSFKEFCDVAHQSATGLKEKIYTDLPALFAQEPNWQILYAEKKAHYLDLLREGSVCLMPGVGRFLSFLEQKKIKRAVVTNSPSEQILQIKAMLPLLSTIPLWITREQYKNPKPSADGYLRALAELSEPGDQVIGFEDTLRGFLALEAAEVNGVVVSSTLSSQHQKELEQRGAKIISSFEELLIV
jgi:beta-phosphoglucomutase